jgi:hypothetical protein
VAEGAPPPSPWAQPAGPGAAGAPGRGHALVGDFGTPTAAQSFGRGSAVPAMVPPHLSPVEWRPNSLDFGRVALDEFRTRPQIITIWSKTGAALHCTIETDVDWLEVNPLYLEAPQEKLKVCVLPGLMSLNQLLTYQGGNIYVMQNGVRVAIIMCEAYLQPSLG